MMGTPTSKKADPTRREPKALNGLMDGKYCVAGLSGLSGFWLGSKSDS